MEELEKLIPAYEKWVHKFHDDYMGNPFLTNQATAFLEAMKEAYDAKENLRFC